MTHEHTPFASSPGPNLPESERSIAHLMGSFEDLLGTYQTAAVSGDEIAREVAREALKEAHLGVLNELFDAHRRGHARTATSRAAGIDPDDPQPVGYVSPADLERLNDDDQAFIEPPSCVAPKSIPVFAERPLSAARLADEMQDVAMTYANGWATDFHAEAARILSNQPRPADTAARLAASVPTCPFCAGTTVATHLDETQGTKWGYASCGECSARGPEVRTKYDCSEQAPWRAQALTEWANRAAASAPAARTAAQLYAGIEAVLLTHTLSHWQDGAGAALPLVDRLCANRAKDISTGREEIRLIVDAIYNDVLTPPGKPASDALPAMKDGRALALVRLRIAEALHYPACWDTAAYPTLESAAWETISCAYLSCSTCNPRGHVQD